MLSIFKQNSERSENSGSSNSEDGVANLTQLRQNYNRGNYADLDKLPIQLQGKLQLKFLALVPTRPQVFKELLKQLKSPARIVCCMQLLAELSSRKAGQKKMVVSLEELSLVMETNVGQEVPTFEMTLEKMLLVSGRAHQFIANNKVEAEEARFKIILSYFNLYLTLEYGITPKLLALYPENSPRQRDGEKLSYFKDLMMEEHNINIPMGALVEYARFGKVYWELAKTCGILSLLMVAVAGTGVTVIARQNGRDSKHVPLLGVELRNSLEWMSACQGLSQVLVEILFTNSQREYKMPEMLSLLVANPLPADFLYDLYQEYLQVEDKVIPITTIGFQMDRPTLSLSAASHTLSYLGIELSLFPRKKYATQDNKVVKLVEWLLDSPPDNILLLNPDPQATQPRTETILLSEFLTFLDTDNLSDSAVGFLSAKWHQEALPGWACISPDQARRIINSEIGTDLKSAIHIAVGGKRFGVPYTNIILPIATNNNLLGLHLSMKDHLATIYSWMPDGIALSGESNHAIKVQVFPIFYQNITLTI